MKLKIINFLLLIKQIKHNSLRNNEEGVFEENLWIFILLIIFITILVGIIVYLLFKICEKSKTKKKQNLNKPIEEERPSQKYNSEYNNKTEKPKKFKYKERMIEKEET